jgi:nucleotide-binding universal stress UspA family protein
VVPKQPIRVASEALGWAQRGSIEKVHFIYANPKLIEIDGTSEPMDPDSLNDSWEDEQKALSDRLLFLAQTTGVVADFRCVAGDPSHMLASLACKLRACAIVIGTRAHGGKAALEEWTRGSVAERLAHRQQIPVLIIPLDEELSDITSTNKAGK